MGTVSRVLLAVGILWNLSALAQRPTPLLPNPKLTPGDVFDVTAQDICVPGYAKKVRAVPAWLKKGVRPSTESRSTKPAITKSII